MLENSSDVIGTGVVPTTLGGRPRVTDVLTLEALFAVVFVFSGWLGAVDVSLDTLEALSAVPFAFSGLLGAGDVSLEVLFAVVFVFSGWLT